MVKRSNEEWVTALRHPSDAQVVALEDLREYLRRAVFVYLRDKRSDLNHVSLDDLLSMSEDFTQDALLLIQQNLSSFRGDARFTTWVYRFVINAAASELRRRQYRHLSLDEISERGTAVIHSIANQSTPHPAQATARQEFIQQLRTIIESELNQRQQIALMGIHFQGMSIQEVTQLLDTSPNTLYKMLHDARKKIKVRLLATHLGLGDILALFDDSW